MEVAPAQARRLASADWSDVRCEEPRREAMIPLDDVGRNADAGSIGETASTRSAPQ